MFLGKRHLGIPKANPLIGTNHALCCGEQGSKTVNRMYLTFPLAYFPLRLSWVLIPECSLKYPCMQTSMFLSSVVNCNSYFQTKSFGAYLRLEFLVLFIGWNVNSSSISLVSFGYFSAMSSVENPHTLFLSITVKTAVSSNHNFLLL